MNPVLLAVGVIAVVAGAFCLGDKYGEAQANNQWHEQLSRERADHEANLKALEASLAASMKEVKDTYDVQLADAEQRVAAGKRDADGLRGELSRVYTRNLSEGSIAAGRSQAAASALVVLGELYDGSVEDRRSLAEALERSRLAGLTCQAAYSKVSSIGLP